MHLLLVGTLLLYRAFSFDLSPFEASDSIKFDGYTLYINKSRFNIKGVAYSPVPIGSSVLYVQPFGDYTSSQYKSIWQRDFPKMKEMGANTVRIYTFRGNTDHYDFLDHLHHYGLKTIITFYMGTAEANPVVTEEQREKLTQYFVANVTKYSAHPAVLGWTMGNEINGEWNGYLEQFNEAFGCGWSMACNYASIRSGPCAGPKRCVYEHLFSWIDKAAQRAQEAMEGMGIRKMITTSFADVDRLTEIIEVMDGSVTHMDAWGIQVYRGKDFGQGSDDILRTWTSMSSRPLIITEYGVDAYRDACGQCIEKNCPNPCFNTVEDPGKGFGEDESTHAEWNGILSALIKDYWNNGTLGGCLMSWVDEYWKNGYAVKGCAIKFGQPGFSPTLCDYKGHVDCPAEDITKNSLCGYALDSTFDRYVNEGWYGINRVKKDPSGKIDLIEPREIFYRMQEINEVPSTRPSNSILKKPWFIAAITLILIGMIPILIHEACSRRNKESDDYDLLDESFA